MKSKSLPIIVFCGLVLIILIYILVVAFYHLLFLPSTDLVIYQGWLNLVVQVLLAVGTFLVAILAIFGGKLVDWLFQAKGIIEIQNIEGDPGQIWIDSALKKSQFFHLKVVNLNKDIPLKDVKVILHSISRQDIYNNFIKDKLAVPRVFYWSPSESSQLPATIRDEKVFDFGRICPDYEKGFRPMIDTIIHGKDDSVLAKENKPARYHLKIEAQNFVSEEQVFEVLWDGQFSEKSAEMKAHIAIKKIALLAISTT